MEKPIITPKTKIYDLLEAFPELEEVLIASAPEFKKLQNPVLRKTIARITSISQAAVIGNLNVEVLVNRLRERAGQSTLDKIEDTGHKYTTEQPAWFSPGLIVKTTDIREMLNRGEQPVHEVLATAKTLKDDEISEIIAPFIPAPLIDKASGLGYVHWLNKKSDEEYHVYLRRG